MRTVIFGFSRPRNLHQKFFAQLIMWADRHSYKFGEEKISHGYTRFPAPAWETSFIYQNAGHSTHFMGAARFEAINQIVEEYELNVEQDLFDEIGKLCVRREGKPYSLRGVVGKGVVLLLQAFNITIRNPFADGQESTDCIEEQAIMLALASAENIPDLEQLSVKPWRDWVSQLPGIRRIK